MKISERAHELAKSIQLTDDDAKRFEPRGSFAQQVKDSIGKTIEMIGHDTKTITERNGQAVLTVLKFSELENGLKSKLTMAYDFLNIFLTKDTKKSLKQIGIESTPEDALLLMAKFTVNKIVPTGIYPMKWSLASMECGFPIGHTYVDADWATLRAKYKDDAFKTARTDNADDISWLEIQHVHISPLE